MMKRRFHTAGSLILIAFLMIICGRAAAGTGQNGPTVLPNPVVNISSGFLAGEPVAFDIVSDIPRDTYISAEIYRIADTNNDMDFIRSFYVSYYGSKHCSLDYGMDAGHYQITVRACSYSSDYSESDSVIFNFHVTGSRPAAPTVAIIKNNQLVTYENQIRISANGMQRYYAEHKSTYGDYWDYDADMLSDGSGTAVFKTTGSNSESYKVRSYRFRAQVNGCWSEYSSEIELTWTTRGPASKPSLTLPSGLKAGEPVIFTLNDGLGEDETLFITVYDANGDEERSDFGYLIHPEHVQNEQITFRAHGLNAGTYTVEAARRKTTYDESEKYTGTFTVTGERPAVPATMLSATSVYEGEKVTFSARCAGLEALAFGTDYDGDTYMASGNRAVVVFRPSYTRDYTCCARVNGRWTENFYTGVITVHDQGNAYLSDIEPHLANRVITVGEPFTFSVDVDPRTEVFAVGIVQVEEDNMGDYRALRVVEYEMIVDVVNGSVTIPGDRFTSPGFYRLNFNAYAEGLYSAYTEGYEVEAQAAQASINMSVSLNTGTAFTAYQDLPVTISAPGCSRAALKVYYKQLMQDEWMSVLYYDDSISVNNGSATVTLACLEPGYYTFRAMGFDGTHWSCWSAEQSLNVNYSEEPIGSLRIISCPEEVVSGEAFTVSWSACPNAQKYEVSYRVSDGALQGEVTVPATQTSASLTITRNAQQVQPMYDGYIMIRPIATGYDSTWAETKSFRLLDSGRPAVTASKTGIGRNESVRLTVSGIRANDLRVKINGVEKGKMNFNTVNDRGTISLSFSREGTYQVQISVRYNPAIYYEGIWSNWSTPVNLTVSGRAGAPDLVLPDDLKTIEREAFMGIDSTWVLIPDGCSAVADRAFADCPNLLAVTIPDTVTSIAGDPFEGCDSSLVIITPAGSAADDFARTHGYSTER